VSAFLSALGLVFVLEGLLFAAFPGATKRALESVMHSPDQFLRAVGLISAVVGLIVIWLVRG
jgi:uncharacterized protein YjeT (DUF2065 family)